MGSISCWLLLLQLPLWLDLPVVSGTEFADVTPKSLDDEEFQKMLSSLEADLKAEDEKRLNNAKQWWKDEKKKREEKKEKKKQTWKNAMKYTSYAATVGLAAYAANKFGVIDYIRSFLPEWLGGLKAYKMAPEVEKEVDKILREYDHSESNRFSGSRVTKVEITVQPPDSPLFLIFSSITAIIVLLYISFLIYYFCFRMQDSPTSKDRSDSSSRKKRNRKERKRKSSRMNQEE